MQVMRERATTFSLAARFLPPAMRRDVGAIYAFFRMVDDAADRPGDRSPVEILEQLARWEVEIAGEAPPSPSVAPVLRVSARYDVPRALLSMVIEGARRDVEGQHIETMDDLRSYSLLVAGSVGMVMAHVLGAASRPALSAAAELGIAMQLTNVARDVGEDMAQGRCYLPAGLLTAAGTARQDLVEGRVTAGFVQVMQAVVGEARASYRRGISGIGYLPSEVRPSILIAARLYAAILEEIEQKDYDVFSTRACLSAARRRDLVLAALLGAAHGDSQAEFDSAVS